MQKEEFSFELLAQENKARLGKISTPRGKIDTPAFMPVGTLGTVKGVFVDDLLKTYVWKDTLCSFVFDKEQKCTLRNVYVTNM